MKKSRRIRIVALLGAFIAFAWFLFFMKTHDTHQEHAASEPVLPQSSISADPKPLPPAPTRQSTSLPLRRSRAEAMQAAVQLVQSIYSAPISFYGRVQDQFGNPIDNARIDYGAIDKFWANGTNYHGFSDKDGYFSLSGIGGAGLTVGVNKDGYDGIKGKSYQVFGYGMGVDEYRKAPPTKDAPAVFTLRKMAPADAVVFISSRQYTLDPNGTPISINLLTGNSSAHETNALQVSCWTNEESKDARRHFDWTCDVAVPGGGLVERTDENLFVAPEQGYNSSEHSWSDRNGLTHRWTPFFEKQYFVRLPGGQYGRISVEVRVGGWSFVTLESFVNPIPGSRNLEYDPKLAVKIP
jgi:hypothetical protein